MFGYLRGRLRSGADEKIDAEHAVGWERGWHRPVVNSALENRPQCFNFKISVLTASSRDVAIDNRHPAIPSSKQTRHRLRLGFPVMRL